MRLSLRRFDLKLRQPFTIARGSSIVDPAAAVSLDHEGIIGYGEAVPSMQYGENIATVTSFLSALDLASFDDPFEMDSILCSVDAAAPGNCSAKTAADVALHDWRGKKLGLPLCKYWGLNKNRTPVTSSAIGIGVVEK